MTANERFNRAKSIAQNLLLELPLFLALPATLLIGEKTEALTVVSVILFTLVIRIFVFRVAESQRGNRKAEKAPAENFASGLSLFLPAAAVIAAAALLLLSDIFRGDAFHDIRPIIPVILILGSATILWDAVFTCFDRAQSNLAHIGIHLRCHKNLHRFLNTDSLIFYGAEPLISTPMRLSYVHCENNLMNSYDLLCLVAQISEKAGHPLAENLKIYTADLNANRIRIKYDTQGSCQSQAISLDETGDVETLPGKGVTAATSLGQVYAGNENLMNSLGFFDLSVPANTDDASEIMIYVALEDRYLGYLAMECKPDPDASAALSFMSSLGLKETVLITTVKNDTGLTLQRCLNIDRLNSDLRLGEKPAALKRYLRSGKSSPAVVVNNSRGNRLPEDLKQALSECEEKNMPLIIIVENKKAERDCCISHSADSDNLFGLRSTVSLPGPGISSIIGLAEAAGTALSGARNITLLSLAVKGFALFLAFLGAAGIAFAALCQLVADAVIVLRSTKN